MSKRRPRRTTPSVTATHVSSQGAPSASVEAFTFGDPLPVLSQRELFDYLESAWNGRWYEPPLSLTGLSRVYRAAVHHASAIQIKRNILRAGFIPHPKLSLAEFTALAMDFLVFGNGYLAKVPNRLGGALRYEHLHAKYVRRGYKRASIKYSVGGQTVEITNISSKSAIEMAKDLQQGPVQRIHLDLRQCNQPAESTADSKRQ